MTPPSLSALGGWAELPFFAADWPRIAEQLAAEPREILPPAPKIFAALEHLQPAAVEVVILGQDPYPTPGHAQGYAFSAEPHVRPIPRSLANIFKELHDDLGAPPEDPDLRFWADQGVLLLNNVLTVPAGSANGHVKLGWQTLTAQVLA
ncbi:uracil-DNA glycosylase, partial [Sulfitobacter sp. HI0082]